MNERSFTKLFSSIVDSSIWTEDNATRIVWVTMLAMADQHGYVGASVPGLAGRARISIEETLAALQKLSSPDPFSRSKEHEGRRIREVERGWLLLNYQRFREARDEEVRREYERLRKRDQRARASADVPPCPGQSGTSPESPALSAQAEADLRSGSDPLSLGSGAPAGARSTPDARIWNEFVWQRKFGTAWSAAYQTLTLPGGGEAATKATAALGDLLGHMTPGQRLAAQDRAPVMFAEFLADRSPRMVKARHPWAWFVTAFNGLLVPAKEPAAPAAAGERVGHVDQRVYDRPNGVVPL